MTNAGSLLTPIVFTEKFGFRLDLTLGKVFFVCHGAIHGVATLPEIQGLASSRFASRFTSNCAKKIMMNNTITRLQTLDVDVPLSLKARLVAIPVLLALLPGQSAWAQDSATIDYPENADHAVTTYVATDPEGTATPSWSLSGADAAVFSIDDGVLTFKSPPNFEARASADGDNIYSVDVVASDGANTSKKTVMVEVTNVEEAGKVTLSALKPQSGTQLTATPSDPDGNMRQTLWQWAKSPTMDGSYTDIANATSPVYTPADADDLHYLRAMASYTDDEGPDKTAMVVSDYAVQRIHGTNHAPTFPTPEISIEVEENTPAGRALGRPIIATDRNSDVLTYSLDAADPDSSHFAIDRATGQLMTKTKLNFEMPVDADTDNSYTVMVKATDPAGIPGTDTAATTATKEVTITVTEVDEAPDVIASDGATGVVMYTELADITVALRAFEATDPDNAGTPVPEPMHDVVASTWNVGGARRQQVQNRHRRNRHRRPRCPHLQGAAQLRGAGRRGQGQRIRGNGVSGVRPCRRQHAPRLHEREGHGAGRGRSWNGNPVEDPAADWTRGEGQPERS